MILDDILKDKRVEIEARKAKVPIQSLLKKLEDLGLPEKPGSFEKALRVSESGARGTRSEIRLIAEIKKASPSKGLIRPDFDPVSIAVQYERSGASAISVLTDEKYFQGHLEYLEAIRREVSLPILRKEFIIDPYQVYESRAVGADAILLIAAALQTTELSELMQLASSIGLDSLVEVHSNGELDAALEVGARTIGINNRDLRTFETRLETTLELAGRVPGDRVLVSESGIFTRADVLRLMNAGVDAVLVGESLMRETDPGAKARELLGNG